MKAIRMHQTGEPDVLALEELETPSPGPGQLLIRHTAIGVNFIDTYHRTGLYPVSLPSGLGMEAAGIVEAVGEGVTRFKAGTGQGTAPGRLGPMRRRMWWRRIGPSPCPPLSAMTSRRHRC